MKIIELTKKEELNNFIFSQKHSQFLQSWEWGEFQINIGNKVFRYSMEENGELIMVATLIKKALPSGRSYFYCPRGPVARITNYELGIKNFFEEIKKRAKEENAIFLRFEPGSQLQITNYKLRIKKTIDIQPSKTLILNLEKSEEELLKAMHQKTRYNIRLAEKKGVKIREGNSDDFEDFWKIMEETNKRDGFRLHSKEHYRKILEMNNDERNNNQYPINYQTGLHSNLSIKLYLAEYQGKIIAGSIISFFGDMVTYMHGASSNEYRNIMAPYLLQWQAIKLAKNLSYKYYDFLGIDEKKWPGVTRFKLGFGGREIKYPGTFDLAFDKMWYNVYRLVRRIRRSL